MNITFPDGPLSIVKDGDEITFETAGDLKFSDLGPPPERAPTEEGIAMRAQADAEAIWNTTCPKCGAYLIGTRDNLALHQCST